MTGIQKTWNLVILPYIGYVMYFLGTGLISGAIVHLPLAPERYTIIMAAGIVLFIAASFVNELLIEKKKLNLADAVRITVFSLLISLGIGMISGGIQHFRETAHYAATLIPLGIALSLFSFIYKQNIRLSISQLGMILLICLLVVIPLKVSLEKVADGLRVETHQSPQDGHNHTH